MRTLHRGAGGRRRCRGFTNVELAVAMAVTTAIGLGAVSGTNFCLNTYAKNVAVNVAHQEARIGTLRILNALHESPAIPQLVDTARANVTTEGPAAGISFQEYLAGPFAITADAAAGATTLRVRTNGYLPPVGSIAVIPTHRVETVITARTMLDATICRVTLSQALTGQVITSGDYDQDNVQEGTPGAFTVLIHFTRRSCFVVVGEDLRYHPDASSATHVVVARGVANPVPFSTPANASGAPHARKVAAINLSTAEGSVSNRDYTAVNMFLNSWVPQRARLTVSK